MKHAQVTTATPNEDGSVTIETKGYFEDLNSIKVQTRQNIETTQATLLTDIIKCLDVLQLGTPELVIRVITDKYNYPIRIEKTWTVKKEKIH